MVNSAISLAKVFGSAASINSATPCKKLYVAPLRGTPFAMSPRRDDLTRIEGADSVKLIKENRFKDELMKDAKKASKPRHIKA